ncbi:alpha-amylase family glycosyl hydrolase [Mucilaginibacter sp. KACC 22063]|uniref:alpha-amylase family glycosyl hydrolase n=1 Tax=Mucilaginibacter sp. KACC 22063 TaxID=3025666 RepID=UPI002365F210|nr:alpha-amylase family glycosyl hydrolase [Mucilaginibacter sp. KACC 22063]WDF55489.1 alpha-amylase family glycosyl hydrolase [Mucilaginibacter sp. KACC 22063]
MRNIYLLLLVLLVFGGTGCKKKSISDDLSGNVPGTDVPASAVDGTTFINSGKSVIFNLYAPEKTSVSVIGDFNNWQPTAMNKSTDGKRWWVQVDNIDPNKEYAYQYLVDNALKVADPYCQKVLDPDNDKYITSDVYPNLMAYPTGKTTGIVSVMQGNQPAYSWKNTTFNKPDKNKLVIYELHVRDFIAAHNYQTLKDTLSYLKNLGVNAIELMPINEFEGNLSWGYNPNFYFAPDKYYGTKNALKAFIDECHTNGIAVIQDMVLNHSFGSSPMVQLYWNAAAQKPAANSPWFNVNPTHPYNVGYDFNHESDATKYFVKNVLKFWMQEYKIDGFRFDLSKGFTQKVSTDDASFSAYDASRIAIWKDYNNFIKGIDPNFYVILEHFAVDQEEQELAAQGMMLWNNMNYNANEATMGWIGTSNFSRLLFNQHGFSTPSSSVSYFESHDEERLQFKNENYGNAAGSYSVKDLATGLKRNEMAAAFMLAAPGPKMIWQFGEVGYDVSINVPGRTDPKPIHWEYMNDANRHHLYATYAKLIRWKIKNDVFNTTSVKFDFSTGFKYIQLTSSSNNVEVVGNFDVVSQTSGVSFPSTGTWYDNITGSSINVTSLPYNMTLAPGEYHVYSSNQLQ